MKYYLIKTNEEMPHADMPYVELTEEEIANLIYLKSFTELTLKIECSNKKLLSAIDKLRKVLE